MTSGGQSHSAVETALAGAERAFSGGDVAAAISALRNGLIAAPASAKLWTGLGVAYRRLNDYAAAHAAFERALESEPDNDRALWALGQLLHALDRSREAIPLFRRLVGAFPKSAAFHFALGCALLSIGEYVEGWRYYDARKFLPGNTDSRPPPGQEWKGEPIEGRQVLLCPEQGHGDRMMASRFVTSLREAGARPVLVATPGLVPLFRATGCEVIEWGATLALPGGALTTLCFSPPMHLQIGLESLPPPLPIKVTARKAGGTIGVVTHGRATNSNDANRSMPEDVAALFRAIPGAVSLAQKDTGSTHFLQTAELIASLDLVITVDTSMGHLAGLLGKPVWILLPAFGADWRWLQGRTDSPWYPSARLFRQKTPGDWRGLLDEVMAALAAR